MNKNILAGTIVSLLIFVMTVPIISAITTEVEMSDGGGNPPIVKCKWEQDYSGDLEDGDVGHNVAGSSFNPPCIFEDIKTIGYYSVVTDQEDMGDVNFVRAEVKYPNNDPKYVVDLIKENGMVTAVNLIQAADAAGLITYNPAYDLNEVINEIQTGTAKLWYNSADLEYDDVNGNYHVDVTAIDTNNNPSDPLQNDFTYEGVNCFEVDFGTVNYGTVNLGAHKIVPGDEDFGTATLPTVRNIGNVPLNLNVEQDDMTFGQDAAGNWFVEFDIKLGTNGIERFYDPYQQFMVPEELPVSQALRLEFSIRVSSGSGLHSGNMVIGSTPA